MCWSIAVMGRRERAHRRCHPRDRDSGPSPPRSCRSSPCSPVTTTAGSQPRTSKPCVSSPTTSNAKTVTPNDPDTSSTPTGSSPSLVGFVVALQIGLLVSASAATETPPGAVRRDHRHVLLGILAADISIMFTEIGRLGHVLTWRLPTNNVALFLLVYGLGRFLHTRPRKRSKAPRRCMSGRTRRRRRSPGKTVSSSSAWSWRSSLSPCSVAR
jgi:hypothetical protein